MHTEVQKWEFWVFLPANPEPWKINKINQNRLKNQSKSTLLHVLCTVGGGVANNLNDASHLPHLAEYFLILFCTSCELTEGSPCRYCTFTSSIRRAPSMTRDSANSQTCRKRGNVWNLVKLHTLVEISEFCIILYVYDRVMFSKMQHLPSLKFFTSSKICTAILLPASDTNNIQGVFGNQN